MRQRLRAHKFQTLHLGSIVQTGLLHLPPEEFATPGGSITPTSSQPWLEAHIDHAGLSLALELRPIANWIEVCEVAGSICSCCPIPGYLTADVADVARQCGCRYFRWRQTFQQWQGPAWFPSRHKMQRERLQFGPTTTLSCSRTSGGTKRRQHGGRTWTILAYMSVGSIRPIDAQ